jgi:hypothetical protein
MVDDSRMGRWTTLARLIAAGLVAVVITSFVAVFRQSSGVHVSNQGLLVRALHDAALHKTDTSAGCIHWPRYKGVQLPTTCSFTTAFTPSPDQTTAAVAARITSDLINSHWQLVCTGLLNHGAALAAPDGRSAVFVGYETGKRVGVLLTNTANGRLTCP